MGEFTLFLAHRLGLVVKPSLILTLSMALGIVCLTTDISAEVGIDESIDFETNQAKISLDKLKTDIAKIRKDLSIQTLGIVIIDNNRPIWIDTLDSTYPSTTPSRQASNQSTHPTNQTYHSTHQDERNKALFPIGAVSSMFVGLSSLKLVEEGRLDLNAKIADLVPDLEFDNPWEDTNPVLFVHLLEQTTGWDTLHYAEHFPSILDRGNLEEELKKHSLSRKSRWVPGTRLSNESSSPAVAAYIIEKITGKPFEEFVQENFFDPLAMTSTTYALPTNYSRSMSVLKVDINTDADESNQTTKYLRTYYPLGSIFSSTSDMQKFLAFMIARGRVDNQEIVSQKSLERMEKCLTTLGSLKGAMVCHGLATSFTGHEKYRIPFYGYRADFSELAYSPSLNSGFFIVSTEKEKGVRTIARKIKAFLLQNTENKPFPTNPLPEEFRQTSGYYKRISGFAERERLVTDLVGILKVSSEEDKFIRSPLLGNFATYDYYEGGEVLTNSWTGLPAIALVEDPLAGEALQAWVTFKKTPAFIVFGKLIYVVFLTLFSIITIIYFGYWIIASAVRKNYSSFRITPLIWPALSSLCIFTAFFTFSSLGSALSLGTISPLSIFLFWATLCYAALAFCGIFSAFVYSGKSEERIAYWIASIISLMHFMFAIYLAQFGLIGVKTWIF